MPTVVGVKLKFAPKVLLFDPAGTEPAVGDMVIVHTERGTEVGHVVDAVREVTDDQLQAPLNRIDRIATDEDHAIVLELGEKERSAMAVYRELIAEHKLDMKPIDVEYLFGGEKVVFYFMAEERVDFRVLVRELASRMHARIDMRQVGVRDEARMVGGLGHCGQQLCCSRFSGEFQPVSIRMAKEQDLPLNPLKISGLCGRLMCCLRYEFEAYKDFKSRAPKKGAAVETPLGDGKVVELNTPRETVKVRLQEGGSFTVPLTSMQCERGCPCKVSRDALEALDDPRANTLLSRMAATAAAVDSAAVSAERARSERARPSGREESSEQSRDSRGSSRRSKRKRGGGGGGAGGSEQKPAERGADSKPAERGGERKAAPAGEKTAAGGAGEKSDAGAGSSGRRRRRRRPPGKGSAPEGGTSS